MFIRAYLRASTEQQDAERASASLQQFTSKHNLRIAAFYIENFSGAKADRPELNRLIKDSHPGDILLLEKVDRLSRLPYEQWKNLKQDLINAGIIIVVVDQPMTYASLYESRDESMISKILTEFLIDLAAGMARDEYETRRNRQAEGIEKAKKLGKYKGRKPNAILRENIRLLLSEGKSWSKIQELLGCSRSTISKAKNENK